MNIKKQKIIIMVIIAMLSIIVMPNMSQAGLQANKGGKSLQYVTLRNFFDAIRKMETQYGTLGTNAVLDTTTYLDTTENGIDCHMILNTEFGTVGILAYSEYGLKPTGSNNDTTTGNASGVYQLAYGNYEYVAGIYTTSNGVVAKADNRYSNKYDSNTSIPGDGVGKLGFSAKYPSSDYNAIFVRGGSGILNVEIGTGDTYISDIWSTRHSLRFSRSNCMWTRTLKYN